MTTTPVPVQSVVYTSTAVTEFTGRDLTALLTVSRRNNARAGLTGMLLYRAGRFLQVLEGPPEPVRALMGRIRSDASHHNVRVLLEEPAPARQFPEWTMRFPAVIAGEEAAIPGYRVTFDDLADEHHDTSTTTPALRQLIKWFQDTPTSIR